MIPLQIPASRERLHAGQILPHSHVGSGNRGHHLNSTDIRHTGTNWQRFRCLGWNLSRATILGDSWNRLLRGYHRQDTGPCGLWPQSTRLLSPAARWPGHLSRDHCHGNQGLSTCMRHANHSNPVRPVQGWTVTSSVCALSTHVSFGSPRP